MAWLVCEIAAIFANTRALISCVSFCGYRFELLYVAIFKGIL